MTVAGTNLDRCSNSHFKTLRRFYRFNFGDKFDDRIGIAAVLFLKTSIRSVGGAAPTGEYQFSS
jgi:hypothetical protein